MRILIETRQIHEKVYVSDQRCKHRAEHNLPVTRIALTFCGDRLKANIAEYVFCQRLSRETRFVERALVGSAISVSA